jgi:GT2 family glycosyltransferase
MSDVGMAVNYYWKSNFSASTQSCAALALRMLRENAGVGTIVLVDGSPEPDPWIQSACGHCDVTYHHAGRELGFAEGYNTGWRLLKEPVVGLMASDIFPPRSTISTLAKCLEAPDVGCVFPYLSFCDYPAQVAPLVKAAVTCEPSAMTLNLNLFKRNVLEQVGGVDERYTGAYNDLILMMRIRRAGHRVVQVGGTYVNHLGQITISQGTTYKREGDRVRFQEEYPELHAKHGKWKVKHWVWPLSTNPRAARWWWLSQNIPSSRLRSALERATLAREPLLTRYPAPWGKGR